MPAWTQNLIPNPSFEENFGCPQVSCNFGSVKDWFEPLNSGTVDYYNSCSTLPICSTPNNRYGIEPPATGAGYAGLFMFIYDASIPTYNYREYMEVNLVSPLDSFYTYTFSLQHSLADKTIFFADGLGVIISDTLVDGTGIGVPLATLPTYVEPTRISNHIGWDTLTFDYQARGGERFVVIGNFLLDNVIDTLDSHYGPASLPFCYVYIDDVSLVKKHGPLGLDTNLCEGDTIVLSAFVPNATYVWQNGSIDSVLEVWSPGEYSVLINTGTQLIRDTINVTALAIDVFLGADVILCNEDSFEIVANSQPADYLWSTGDTGLTAQVDSSGIYRVEITNGSCYDSDSIEVEFKYVALNLGDDTVLCDGVALTLSDSTPGFNRIWSDSSTDTLFTITQAGNYWLKLYSPGCDTTDSIYVDYINLPVSVALDTTKCENDTIEVIGGSIEFDYLWWDGSMDSANYIFNPGSYWVQISNQGCFRTDSIQVDSSGAIAILIEDTIICDEIFLPLVNLGRGFIYEWSDGSVEEELIVNDESTYSLTISDGFCEDSDSVLVRIKDCDCYLFVPNTFTPNGDGLNENFGPEFDCDFITYQFAIYDRWGGEIFHTSDPSVRWDGSINSQPGAMGFYWYVLQYQFSSGDFGKKIGKVLRTEF